MLEVIKILSYYHQGQKIEFQSCADNMKDPNSTDNHQKEHSKVVPLLIPQHQSPTGYKKVNARLHSKYKGTTHECLGK